MMSKKAIKIICFILAGLMVLSVFAVCLQVFAFDGVGATVTPVTGDNDSDYIIPATIGVIAVLAIGICIFLPKFKKKQ